MRVVVARIRWCIGDPVDGFPGIGVYTLLIG
jgi:hypothetical protein